MDRNIDGDVTQYNFGLVLKETILNLGPTFIKVGQSLSTRPDIIGATIDGFDVAVKVQRPNLRHVVV
ncbi:Uncharacterized protein sll0005 [Camellia lanceoleosa]|uniref:Uncharacterized protein sll0005 n=1 Tax=Camellia lanceoleosa TaxID=1840588 RepID=A0ACC0F2N9_9ERIC|nr:Uncharacterized protein sll0005 [Camellia lanceoleosa]